MSIESLNELPATRAYLARIGAEPRSLKTAVVKETRGKYWKDLASINFARNGTIEVSNPAYTPTDSEAAAIVAEFAAVRWPLLKPLMRIINPPDMIANANAESVFEFRDETSAIVFVQVRIETAEGKKYIPWTYWDDDRWRCMEPEGSLPLYNADRLRDSTTVFIHEGAKAARAMQRLCDDKPISSHPWGAEMLGAAHVGWTGGAMSPYRTDWSVIGRSGAKRVYIVADNDTAGKSAVPAIAQHLRLPTFMIQFTEEFPPSFDLADAFPENMFSTIDGARYYVGPDFRDCLHPATWATDLIPNKKGKPTPILRDSFRGMWAYVEETDIFVCTEMPEIMRAEAILNKMLAAFSHTAETTRLIVKAYQGRSARICYRPDQKGLLVTFRGSSAINLHVPTVIKSRIGDATPWLEFLDYLFVNETERQEVRRWCATLIAKTNVRIGYGLLLISERQGVGKTTLGASILAPLVGPNNVGFPGEADIIGNFNDWVANKRLVLVNEIYSGSSWKAYHSLKGVITDRDITVNQKYMRPYTIENWCHVVACSNSPRAMKMENDDRRWFYPEVTEVPWPDTKFVALRAWLERGGLSIIKNWAENFGNYIKTAERAPMTERKIDMIEGSRSEAQREAAALAGTVKDFDKPIAFLMYDIVGWVRNSVQGRVFDSDYELRKAMIDAGMKAWPNRIKVAGRLQYVVINMHLYDKCARINGADDGSEALATIRASVTKPNDVLGESM